MLELINVAKSYESPGNEQGVSVLKNITLKIEKGRSLVIVGPSGSGKSTLMNMLREDLTKWGFRPIWFNAWHHQTEEHFLASLLESIRKQAVPRLLTLRGLRFRFRLLWFRSHWYWLSIMALALLTAFGINQFWGFFSRIKKYLRLLEVTSGIIMVIVGVMIFTNKLVLIQSWLPFLNRFAL